MVTNRMGYCGPADELHDSLLRKSLAVGAKHFC